MDKPKTINIKPVMAWGLLTARGTLFEGAHKTKRVARGFGGRREVPIRVEIRDAATAKLERAVIEAAKGWRKNPGIEPLYAALDALAAHEAKAVRRG